MSNSITVTERAPITYGEAYTAMKDSMRLVKGRWVIDKPVWHKPRMSNKDADVYYTKKIREEFVRLGYTYKNKKPKYINEGFDSIEDYYGYYEAKKIKEEYDTRRAG